MYRTAILFVALASFACTIVTAGDAKSDAKQLQGSWSVEKGGKKIVMTFQGDTFKVEFGELQTITGKFKVDPTKKPKEIDLTVTEGPKPDLNGKTALGIYELSAESFRWCANQPGMQDRPAAFLDSDGEKKFLQLTFKRAK